jgi:hypothetical protein
MNTSTSLAFAAQVSYGFQAPVQAATVVPPGRFTVYDSPSTIRLRRRDPIRRRRLGKDVFGNHHTLDFGGALVDLRSANVTEEAFDR